MRIVHSVHQISREAAGPSYSIARLCESLIAGGDDVTLCSMLWDAKTPPPPFLRGFPAGIGPYRLGRSPEMKRWIMQSASQSKIEVLHSHGLWMMPSIYPSVAAAKYSLPIVVSTRGMLSNFALQSGSPVKRVFWPLIQRPALTKANCLHATSVSEYEDIRSLGFRQPVALIPNGIDIPNTHKVSQTADKRTLLFMGRIHPTKGLDLLLPAWASLQERRSDWKLVIAGPGESGYVAQMRQLAQSLKLRNVEFVGALYGDAKQSAYSNADLFVLPSYSENFGMTVAESLASGTPTVVSKGAPWAELEARGCGWWFELGTEPLVQALDTAMALSQRELSDMGARGKVWMQADYSWERVGGMMRDAYRWLQTNDRPPEWIKLY